MIVVSSVFIVHWQKNYESVSTVAETMSLLEIDMMLDARYDVYYFFGNTQPCESLSISLALLFNSIGGVK